MPSLPRRSALLSTLLLAVALATGAPSPADGASGFVYALQDVASGPNQIYGFRLEPTGGLIPLPGFPKPGGGNGRSVKGTAEQLRYDPATSRLYAINTGSRTLSVFAVDRTTGALTALPFSPISL